jgi:hypothetical protein
LIGRACKATSQAIEKRYQINRKLRNYSQRCSLKLPASQTAIREAGADNVAAVLQGRFMAGDVIAGAGIAVQAKTTKASPP